MKSRQRRKLKRGTQVTQVVKAYAGGNNEAWAIVLFYSTVVQCSTVLLSTVQYSSRVVYSTLVQGVVYSTLVQHRKVYGSTYSSSTVGTRQY